MLYNGDDKEVMGCEERLKVWRSGGGGQGVVRVGRKESVNLATGGRAGSKGSRSASCSNARSGWERGGWEGQLPVNQSVIGGERSRGGMT